MKKKCMIAGMVSVLLISAICCKHITFAVVDEASKTNQEKLQNLLDSGEVVKIFPESSSANKDNLQHLIDSGDVVAIQPKEIVENITMTFDYDLVLPTLEDLEEKAPYIFEGILKESDSYVSSSAGGTIETDYYYEVTQVFKGDLKQGEAVKVNSLGGKVSSEEYFSEVDKISANGEKLSEQKNTYVASLIEGAPMPEVGKKYLLFTGYFNGVHNTLGMNQGLFYPDGAGNYYRYYPKSLSTKETIKEIMVNGDVLEPVRSK